MTLKKAAFLLATASFLCINMPSPLWAGSLDDADYLTEDLVPTPEENLSETIRAMEEAGTLLYDVMKEAYRTNPTLRAGRAQLRALNEKLPQAQANYRPTVTADADATHVDTSSKGNSFVTQDGSNFSKTMSVNLTQPVYRGGRTMAATSGAENLIYAGRQALIDTEQQLMLSVATAYMDVLRDRALLNVAKNNESVIARQLEAVQQRLDVGEVTETDLAQSQARHAAAEAGVTAAEANLRASSATYEQVTGQPPEDSLLYPENRLMLPATLEEANIESSAHNPSVRTAEYLNAAAEDNVDETFGELLPSISLGAGAARAYDPQPGFLDRQDTLSLGLSASIPLYQGGAVRSRVREAKYTANQRFMQILESRRAVRQQTIAAWERMKAAQAEIASREAQVRAAQIAQEGVHYEADFGERTILDALDADQEALDAQVGLISARRDEVVAQFTLASALGILQPEYLGFPEETIDHKSELRSQTWNLFGINAEIDGER